MRTTVTLDADVEAKLRATMRERGLTFKAALNDAVRSGLDHGSRGPKRYRMPTAPMGSQPGIDIDKALRLAGELEDEEIIRKLELGK